MTMANDAQERTVRAPLERAARNISEPFREFVETQSASGWMLLSSAALGIVLANSSLSGWYFDLREADFGVMLAGTTFENSLQHWVNDGLMALFFFLLGLEFKREFLVGQLSERRRAASVACAAVGGIVLPALIFLLVSETAAVRSAWGVPIATDTAFALFILLLVGDRVPISARAFLVGLAIIDDLAAISVIALVYTTSLEPALILPALGCLGGLIALNVFGVRDGLPYLATGAALWVTFVGLGFHGTLAGIAVAAAAPVRPAIRRDTFLKLAKEKVISFQRKLDQSSDSLLGEPEQQKLAEEVSEVAEKATVPLRRWEHKLEKPISFLVVPFFAFMNSGFVLSGGNMVAVWANELSLAICLGLLIGKPIGIVAGTWVGKQVGLAELPGGLMWSHVFGIGLLGGIGFTMSLFIATLSFGEGSDLLEISTRSIIGTSLFAGIAAYSWLRWLCPAVDPEETHA